MESVVFVFESIVVRFGSVLVSFESVVVPFESVVKRQNAMVRPLWEGKDGGRNEKRYLLIPSSALRPSVLRPPFEGAMRPSGTRLLLSLPAGGVGCGRCSILPYLLQIPIISFRPAIGPRAAHPAARAVVGTGI